MVKWFETFNDDNNPSGVVQRIVKMSSLDVPVHDTLYIILRFVYGTPNQDPPKTPREVLGQLKPAQLNVPSKVQTTSYIIKLTELQLEVPWDQNYRIFYMCDLENRILSNILQKPSTYCRYVIMLTILNLVVRNEEYLIEIKK